MQWELASRKFVRNVPGGKPGLRFTQDGQHFLQGRSLDPWASMKGNVSGVTLGEPDTNRALAAGAAISDDGHVVVTDFYVNNDEVEATGKQYKPPPVGIVHFDSGARSTLPRSEGYRVIGMSEHGDTLVLRQDYQAPEKQPGRVANAVDTAVAVASMVPYTKALVTMSTSAVEWTLRAGAARTATGLAASVAGNLPVPSDKPRMAVWDLQHQHTVLTVPSAAVQAFALSADGHTLIVKNADQSVDAFDLSAGKQQRLAGPGPVPKWQNVFTPLVMSHDGKEVAITDPNGAVTLVDPLSAQVLQRIPPPEVKPEDMAKAPLMPVMTWLSPDGRFVARRHIDLRVWEVATGRLVVTSPAYSIAFTGDESVILGFPDLAEPVAHDLNSGKEELFAAATDDVATPVNADAH
jgi:hypothetical protein